MGGVVIVIFGGLYQAVEEWNSIHTHIKASNATDPK